MTCCCKIQFLDAFISHFKVTGKRGKIKLGLATEQVIENTETFLHLVMVWVSPLLEFSPEPTYRMCIYMLQNETTFPFNMWKTIYLNTLSTVTFWHAGITIVPVFMA